MEFRVTEVIDGDTFKVSPGWKWNKEEGYTVRAKGYNAPEAGQPGFEAAKAKLEGLILGKSVELKKAIEITYGRLLCDVYIAGENLADYFTEYR